MILGDLLRTAASNLGRRKVRTALTTVGIVVGITTIVTMLSLAVGVQREIRRQFESIGLENVFVRPQIDEESSFTQFTRPVRSKPISRADVERWRRLPGVATVEPQIGLDRSIVTFLQRAEQRRQVRVDNRLWSSDEPEPFMAPPYALAGLMHPQSDDQIVIFQGALPEGQRSPETAQALLGQPVQIVVETPRGERQAFDFQIAGISSEDGVGVRLTAEAQGAIKSWWFNSPDIIAEEGYDQALVRASDLNAARQLVPQLRAEGYEVRSLEMVLEVASKIFVVINTMLGSIGGLALFVAAVGIINTMVMAIYERTREIGTLKALGASRGDIRALFVLEAGLIGMLGGLIGTLLGWLIGLGLDRLAAWFLERQQIPLRGTFFVLPLWLIGLALLFATLIGIMAGLYPASRAARLDPIQALRHE